jgi:hypothetical protein
MRNARGVNLVEREEILMRNKVFRLTTALVLVAAGALGLQLYSSVTAERRTIAEVEAQQPELLHGPSQWVEFTAVATKTDPNGPPVVGRFFRGADGSERLDTGPALDNVGTIMINNLTTERYYNWSERTGWINGPMQVPPELKRPMAYRKGMFASTATAIKYGEFDALQVSTGEGSVSRLVPALNFFAIDRLSPLGGRISFTDVRVGPVAEYLKTLPAAIGARYAGVPLFEPPPGADVRITNTPGGITKMDRGAQHQMPPK